MSSNAACVNPIGEYYWPTYPTFPSYWPCPQVTLTTQPISVGLTADDVKRIVKEALEEHQKKLAGV